MLHQWLRGGGVVHRQGEGSEASVFGGKGRERPLSGFLGQPHTAPQFALLGAQDRVKLLGQGT